MYEELSGGEGNQSSSRSVLHYIFEPNAFVSHLAHILLQFFLPVRVQPRLRFTSVRSREVEPSSYCADEHTDLEYEQCDGRGSVAWGW